MLLECYTGRPPFFMDESTSFFDLSARIHEHHPHAPAHASSAFKDMLHQCFLLDKDARPGARQLLMHGWLKENIKPNSAVHQPVRCFLRSHYHLS